MLRKFPVTLVLVLVFSFPGVLCPVLAEGQQDRRSGSGSGRAPDINSIMGDVSGAFSQMNEALRPPASEMNLEDEYYLGRAVAAEILRAYKPYIADPALTAYLNRICFAITVNSPRPSLFSGYSVEILDTDEICAFASPGGHIFISRGLIAVTPSEDTLAAVIAHEVAHIQLRHVAAILSNERTVQDLSAAAERAASIASRHLTAQERAVLFRESLSVTVNTLFRNGYSREQEFEADRMARLLLINAGYDPAALAELLGILSQRLRSGNMDSTHPTPATRIASLGNLPGNIRTGTGRETLSDRRPRFNSTLKR